MNNEVRGSGLPLNNLGNSGWLGQVVSLNTSNDDQILGSYLGKFQRAIKCGSPGLLSERIDRLGIEANLSKSDPALTSNNEITISEVLRTHGPSAQKGELTSYSSNDCKEVRNGGIELIEDIVAGGSLHTRENS